MADLKVGQEVTLRATVTRVGAKGDPTFTVWIENYPIPLTLPKDTVALVEVIPKDTR
jgi:hypothetical protein